MLQVTGINIFPIKSCGGVRADRAEVEARGLAGDRRFMLVDGNGRFMTQRKCPALALVRVSRNEHGWLIEAPGQEPLVLRAPPEYAATKRVRIWRGIVEASIATPEINEWFTAYTGTQCRLAYMEEHQHRAVPHASAEFDDEVSFADGAPLLVISEASLRDLNGRLANAVTMDRFRPNIVIDGSEPYEEDGWKRIRIGEAELAVSWPCARCIMVTIDPVTGVPDRAGEPLETLKTYRRRGRGVYFGQNVIARRLGAIRVGDAVEVIRE